mmetsp:Transcript_36360/g.35981  ORF Transcript_36360/g.35981 Transcript_36360/m.35981 type:complete len:122 (+) Transcript_36360:96-461(+)
MTYIETNEPQNKNIGQYYYSKEHFQENSTARFRHDANKLLEDKQRERICTENSNMNNTGYDKHYNSPKFPMSDTFFDKNKASDEESARAIPPMTNTNISSDNYLMEDSMNMAMDNQEKPSF